MISKRLGVKVIVRGSVAMRIVVIFLHISVLETRHY